MDQRALPRRIARRIRTLPAQMATIALNTPMLEKRLTEAYERARTLHKPKLQPLSPADTAIVAGLERNGVHITTLDALAMPGTEAMWEPAVALASTFAGCAARGEYARQYMVQAGADDLMRHPEIVRWGLNERILNIVEAYLGLPASYDALNMFYTVADGAQVASRKWHRDVEDRRMVKVIVYLHDVCIGTGPLEILHRGFPGSDRLAGSNYPVLTHETLEQRLGGALEDGDATTCTGLAGTVIFADVASHYHRGRPATARDRCALFYNYFSRVPLRPFFCQRHVFSRAQLAEIAEGLPARARDCLLWHKRLPWIAKLVPPAPL